jgi:hypothetical protein
MVSSSGRRQENHSSDATQVMESIWLSLNFAFPYLREYAGQVDVGPGVGGFRYPI